MVSTRQMSGNGVNGGNSSILRVGSHNYDLVAPATLAANASANMTVSQQQLLQPCSHISMEPPALSLLVPANYPATAAATPGSSSGPTVSTASSAPQSSTSTSAALPVASISKLPLKAPGLLDMPVEILDKVFAYVGYKKVTQLRTVSTQMNQICSTILNSTFMKLQNHLFQRFQTVKAKMPRRESARRSHQLACECDILETCYMRLSLLQMTFGKHIERKYCCFFPGGILDEIYSVLNYIKTNPKLGRPYKVTDELFDLSAMAMEYFKDHIEPALPDIGYFKVSSDFSFPSPTNSDKYLLEQPSPSSSTKMPPQSNMVLRKGIRKIKQGMKRYNSELSVLRSELRTCKRKATEQSKQIAEQQKLFAEQQKQTVEYANRLDENDKKNEEISKKFSSLLQELNKCKTELQYWRSKSPATPVNSCVSCGQPLVNLSPEDIQALVNQGVKPEDLQVLPYINETSLPGDEEDLEDAELAESGEFILKNEKHTNDNNILSDNKDSQQFQLCHFGNGNGVSLVPELNQHDYFLKHQQQLGIYGESLPSTGMAQTKNNYKRKADTFDISSDNNTINNHILSSDVNIMQKQLSISATQNSVENINSNKKIRKVQIKVRSHTNNFNATTKTRSNKKD